MSDRPHLGDAITIAYALVVLPLFVASYPVGAEFVPAVDDPYSAGWAAGAVGASVLWGSQYVLFRWLRSYLNTDPESTLEDSHL